MIESPDFPEEARLKFSMSEAQRQRYRKAKESYLLEIRHDSLNLRYVGRYAILQEGRCVTIHLVYRIGETSLMSLFPPKFSRSFL